MHHFGNWFSYIGGAALLLALPLAGQAQSHYVAINTPPTLHYQPDVSAAPSSNVYKEITVCRKPATVTGSMNWEAADIDSDNGGVTMGVDLIGGEGIVTLAFSDSVDIVETLIAGRKFTMTAPIANVEAALASLNYKATADADVDVYITLSDNGFSGACSKTNAAICARKAQAKTTMHFKQTVPPCP